MSGSRQNLCLRQSQQGVALIVALLILAIATGLASAMIVRNQNAFNATAALENGARADELANSAFILAQALLDQDDRNIDGPADTWAQPLPGVPLDGATVSIQLIDMQGRFNLNNLITVDDKVNLVAKERFQKLLYVLKIQPDISNAIIDWIDTNQNIEPSGGEDGSYQANTPPGLPAGRPMISVTELRAVHGVTESMYEQLAPYVTALPVGTPINLNSAAPRILQALGANPRLIAQSAIDQTTAPPPKNVGSVADFLAQPEFAGTVIPPEGLAVNSQFFLCVVTVQMDTVTRTRYAMIERPSSGNSRLIALSEQACLTRLSCL